ncbi:Dolichyl-diphosphooligosaccharide--protein glycosyltransferase subunit dad-1 [Grifola frondosa]|uniref:Dolichyl-diphosphooligosaccharide--protein glycosyltransferase subunit OST2 n=1 Tax=Grifola frondosa TaxID=5627 RepID=A0A1C7M4V8_GRIFR|nr:Dolichyl-diphosphooligosaccharide--protein glycosyltransferase subunit dad-1 [Grifola frondosa]
MAGPKTSTTLKQNIAASSTAHSSNPVNSLWKAYNETTSTRLKTIDAFLVFLMLSGIAQFLYCVLVTNFPFNAFLAGFSSCVGQFVLAASLRSQVNPANRSEFKDVSPERYVARNFLEPSSVRPMDSLDAADDRAFADFALGSIVLHFFVFNFLG